MHSLQKVMSLPCCRGFFCLRANKTAPVSILSTSDPMNAGVVLPLRARFFRGPCDDSYGSQWLGPLWLFFPISYKQRAMILTPCMLPVLRSHWRWVCGLVQIWTSGTERLKGMIWLWLYPPENGGIASNTLGTQLLTESCISLNDLRANWNLSLSQRTQNPMLQWNIYGQENL